ncbi:MAG: phosphoglycolate phosphatase [Rubrivivax sp.]|jgi:phosphoglycolate phosphatase|nr:phosphoglycolate phosphatase [Rubrivivax sp.]
MTTPAHFRGQRIAGLLFDLDGTLLDTAGDIAQALARALADRGLPAPAPAQVRNMIGRGAPTLVRRASEALGLGLGDEAQAQVLQGFFQHYEQLQQAEGYAPTVYPGVLEGLTMVRAAGLRMGVVTNKQHRFAQHLLAHRGIAPLLDIIVGGDTCERRKPDPQPLLWAASQLGLPPEQMLMVGDSVNDVSAGLAAGMSVVAVPYGYNEGQDPRLLPAHGMVETMAELPSLLGLPGAKAAQP